MRISGFGYFRSSDRLETGTIGFLALLLVLKVNSQEPSFNRFDVRAKKGTFSLYLLDLARESELICEKKPPIFVFGP